MINKTFYAISCYLMLVVAVNAQEPCFLLAENYYEQLYCEVKAKGEGQTLPRFYDFKQNNPTTQALLLKRPASRLGITVLLPKPQGAKANTRQNTSSLVSTAVSAQAPRNDALWQGCNLLGPAINCQAGDYRLVGNRSNRHLQAGALDQSNQLLLPHYQGATSNSLRQYLINSYSLYLNKMLEIGLGGSTMSFAKFSYLYFDLTDKGADFAERSKTVFNYLKLDKQRIAVSEALADTQGLTLQNCNRIGDKLITCDYNHKNYLYVGH